MIRKAIKDTAYKNEVPPAAPLFFKIERRLTMKHYEKVIACLHDAGKEGYLVGGCVRDQLLGKVPHDYDVTTNALPEEMKEIFSDFHLVETGLKHGTVTVMCDGEPIEVTTYRVDGSYSDGRHPDSVCFSKSLIEDLKRRDFTVNAMAMTVNGEVVDPFGGREDLKNGVIRAVGDPYKRFEEDALRILRAVRFSSVLGFPIEETTVKAAEALLEKLTLVSRERCFIELKKTLCGKSVRSVLTSHPRIFAAVIPEILPMIGFDQMNPHHCYDLLTHTAIAVESAPCDPIFRLAALFHDMGKPFTQSIDEQGIAHYYGHAATSTRIAEQRLLELKSDKHTLEEVVFLVKHHDAPPESDREQIAKKLRRFGEKRLKALISMRRADNLAQSSEFYRKEIHDQCIVWIDELLLEQKRCFTLKDLAVNGADLIKEGYKPGPSIGVILEELLIAVSEGRLPNKREVLLIYVKNRK